MQAHILLTDDLKIKNIAQLNHLLSAIFNDDPEYVARLQTMICEADPSLQQINSVVEVVKILKQSFKNSLNWSGYIPPLDAKHLLQLASFEETAIISQKRYSDQGKPKEKSIFWPNPSHAKHPSSRFSTLPYVKKHPLIDKNTPIGSAGSCFAIEIARALQEQAFNYVVTERADDPSTGVYVDNYTAGDEFAPGSFNSGIQFNTVNFRHLAEKAFGTREFKPLVIELKTSSGGSYYRTPYRDHLFFTRKQDSLDEYQKQRDAVREALATCEVFILTTALSEDWEQTDGTVLARNPFHATYPYVKQKTPTASENPENLDVFLNMVNQHNPNFKQILSLSAVTFLATNRSETHHATEVNHHSKPPLRKTIDEVVRSNPNIYYLPSYKSASHCSKKPWAEDDRHVQSEAVRKIV